MNALLIMSLIAVYLGSNILLYNQQDDENPFFIVFFLGVALGASLASPKVPLLLIFLGVVSAVIAILLTKKFKMLIFIFQGLVIWALSTLIVMDVRAHGHDIATATFSLAGIAFMSILCIRFKNIVSRIGFALFAMLILLFAFGGELFAAFACDVVLFIAMMLLL